MQTFPNSYRPELRGPLQPGTGVLRVRLPYGGRIKSVQAFAELAGSGSGTNEFDVKINAASVFSGSAARPKIASSALASALVAPDTAALNFTANQLLTIDCLQVTEFPPRDVTLWIEMECDAVPNSVLRFVADQAVAQYRVVRALTNGKIRHADTESESQAWEVVGVALDSADANASVSVLCAGLVENPAWDWSMGSPLYFDDAGTLTQDVPATGFRLPVAVPVSPTRILVRAATPMFIQALLADFGITDAVKLTDTEFGDIQTGGARLSGLLMAARLLLGGAGGYDGSNKIVVGQPNQSYPTAEIVVSPSDDEKVCLVLERKTATQSTPLLKVKDETGATLGEINQTGGWSAPAASIYCAQLQCGAFGSSGNVDFTSVGTSRLLIEYTGNVIVRDNTRLVENVKTLTPGATVALSSIQGNVFTLVPDQDCTININNSYPDALQNGQEFDVVLVTSGTTSWTVGFGTGFVADGTLATGTVDGKRFVLSFRVVGGVAIERSRKGPL